jgi:hypothetical protein
MHIALIPAGRAIVELDSYAMLVWPQLHGDAMGCAD